MCARPENALVLHDEDAGAGGEMLRESIQQPDERLVLLHRDDARFETELPQFFLQIDLRAPFDERRRVRLNSTLSARCNKICPVWRNAITVSATRPGTAVSQRPASP